MSEDGLGVWEFGCVAGWMMWLWIECKDMNDML